MSKINEKNEQGKKLILDMLKDEAYKPMKIKDMAFFMAVPGAAIPEFYDVIDSLEKEGAVVITPRGKVMLPENLQMVTGLFHSNARGYGFVLPDDTRERDVFISAGHTNGAMHKDTVLVKVTNQPGDGSKAEGEIIKVLKRGLNSIVGTYEKSRNFGFVVPDDQKVAQDIYIPGSRNMGAVSGHKVVVKITKPGDIERHVNPEGKVVEILGHANDPGVDILSIVRQFELPVDFPDEVLKETEAVPETVEESAIGNRLDLRLVTMVTIDGEDSKDLDDAVSLEQLADGNYRLGVHIADVADYVLEGSPLDQEALKRGTSVYLVDRVIPMLPHRLSNGICSLNAGEDRLALSCIMDIDDEGNVVAHKIAETVIHIDKRLSYQGVNAAFDGQEPYVLDYEPVMPMLRLMGELAEILRQRRVKRGAIDFGFAEAKIILDKAGNPIDIVSAKRSFSSGIIEEFMLVCNETVAEQYFWLEMPFVYRTHEEPDREKMEKLAEFVSHFGYHLKGQQTHAKSIQKLLRKFEGTEEETIISRVALRSLKQARYSPECEGHFGLAAKYYSHFTSPIRRYPDLQIHRIIKKHLRGQLSEGEQARLAKLLPEVCRMASLTERTAEEAEREVDSLKKVQFMQDKVGEVFEGFISSVTSWGIYVELPNTVEGMVPLAELRDDYYVYDRDNYMVIGERKKKIYRLGQKVTVMLTRAGMEDRKLDFMFVEEEKQ